MEIAIVLLTIGVLFVSGRTELSEMNLPINEEYSEKRSPNVMNSSALSEIEMNWTYSPDRGYEVTCGAIGQNLSYSWTAQNGTLRNKEVAKGNVLTINPVTKKNDRTFCCVATNTLLTKEKCITIKRPTLEVYHVVILGSSLNLECHGFATTSNVKINWAREDGHQFAQNVMKSSNGSLAIKNITRADRGRYKCTARKRGLSASVTTIIEVVMIPVISIIPGINGNITAKLGEKMNLTCNTDGYPQPSVLWQKLSSETELDHIGRLGTRGSAVHQIQLLSGNEAGIYICWAENSAGSSNKTVRVISEWPVLEVYPNGSHVVIARNSITLECRESVGYSNMTFTWSRENEQLFASNVHQSHNGSLTITDIAIDQEGHYKCSASNGLVSASVTTEIEVRTLPVIRIPEITDRNITKKLGDETKLICEAEGHPAPTVQLQKFSNESYLNETVLRAATELAVYEIMSLSTSEAGLYLCSAVNPAGSSNKTVRIVIKQPVLEVYPKESHVVIAGNSITLECRESVGYSNMTFTWSRENKQFASNVHQSHNGSLTITDIAIDQEGHYKCSASNGLASASITTKIEVRRLPVITIPEITDRNITKRLGDEIKLTCKAEGHPAPTVQLQKFSNESYLNKTVLRAATELTVYEITSLSTSEAGLYLCSAVNPAGSSNKTVRVVIKPPVLEVYPKESHVVIAGNSITLECRESVGYSNMTFTWSRENKQFASNVHQSHNGSLTITDIAIDQEGHYKCSASNGLASASITTKIEVRTLPVITIPEITDGNVTKRLGDEIKLTCKAEGHPAPTVQLQKFSNESYLNETVLRVATELTIYEITSLSTSEAGLYLCSAVNPAGSSNKTVRVVIKQPVLEVYPKESHVVIAGNSITLECRESVGYSNMTFTWSRENKQFASNVHQLHNGSLTITDLAIDQEGHYKCSASNGLASASITTKIEVRTLPVITIPEITDGNITKRLGDEIKLTCKAEGHPAPTVQLQKFSNESYLDETVLRAATELTIYEITSLSTSEAGLYLCSAVNPAGSSNKTVRVVIKPPVLEVYPKESHVVIAGNSITLECRESVGYSNMTFTWSRENKQFASNVHQSHNGSLTITDIAIDQEGHYKCSASNGLASASITTKIEVRRLPVITIPEITDRNITKRLGDEIKLTCKAEGHPAPTVQVQKFSNESYLNKTVLRAATELTVYEITSLSTSEAGLYLCSAVNPAGSSNKTVRVVIKPPVLEVYPKESHVVIAGNSITLECRESVGYSNMTFTWSRENKQFASNVHQSHNGSLTITDIAIDQEGHYKCSASNGLASASITTKIEVRTLPVITIPEITDGNVTKRLGDEIKLTCKAEGHPAPTVQLQKFSNESYLNETVLRVATELTIYEITSLSTSEAGLYLCSAVNPAGSSNKTVRVVIKPPVLEVYPKESHVVIAGNSITLECRESVGYSNMTFTWSRENKQFASNVHQSHNGSLTITDIAIDQEGHYKCSASNGLASASITTKIEVRTLPVITIPEITDGNITKRLGDEIKLTCKAEGHPAPTVQLQKFSNESYLNETVLRAATELTVYEITSLSTSEAGLYLCSAVNPAGSSNKTVRVVIKQPVLEVYPKESHVVIAGNSITLECRESVGYSNMTFTWSRENKQFAPNVHQSHNGSLTITDIAIDQEGHYKCSASNGLASASITTKIDVRTLPVITIPEITDGNVTKRLGDEIKLTCKAEGHPAPTVQLQKFSNESYLNETVLRVATELTIYEITSLSTSEAGLYLCSAVNPAGSSNKTVRVVIKPPVLEVYPKESHVVIAGNSITLECRESVGYSNMTFTWSRENKQFASNVHQSHNGSLTITDIAIDQEGHYKCSASNGLASASITTKIEVRRLPVITIPEITDRNITKRLGDEIKLTCKAEGHPAPTVQVQKFSNESYLNKTVLRAATELTVYEITSLSTSEAGLYLCSAVNPAGSSNKTVRVVIKPPVLEVYPKESHVVIAGNSITLECRESVGYSNMTFTWSRENKQFASNVHQSHNGSLTITDIAIDQEGHYKCSASNGLASASITTKIEVRTLPVITIPEITDGNVTKRLGDEIKLTCKAEGHPAPTVQLQKFSNESYLNETVLRVATELTIYEITSLSTSEAGLYLCSAVNPAGSSNKTVRVVIKPPVLEVYPKESHVVIAGNSITLECRESVGYSNMTFTWSRENKQFASNVHQSHNGSLTITDIAIDQEGHYKCSASNGLASASITTKIEVRTLPVITIPEITDGNITKRLGDEIKLTCKAEGHPAPTVQLQKFSNESYLNETVLRAATELTVYEITSLSTSEAGLYLCSAVNPAGSSNKTVRVVIKQPVLEVYPKESHVVIAGNSITLECRESVGYSNMTFTWSRENKQFAPNVHQSHNGSLTITDIAIDQEGHYKCSASNGLASASITTKIDVRTLPVITIPEITDGNVTKRLGDEIKLTCKAEGHPAPTVQLQKFSNESYLNETVLRVATELTIYEITSLSTSEAGLYLCSAVNPAGSSNKTVRVVIKPPVLEVYPKESHVVIAGNSITLECRESVGYSNMTFTWSRENKQFASNVHQSHNGSLTITDIAIDQEGHYKCSASNGLASASITTEIEVRTLPVITIPEVTNGNITKRLGDEIKLTCKAEGHPAPNVQLRKFSEESHLHATVLRAATKLAVHEITSLSTSEAGLYLCSATNPAGSSNKTLRVVIQQPVLEVYPEESHLVIAGNSITLECRESVGYSNMTLTWSREDDFPFASNVHQSHNGSLTITNITINQEGHYKCSASNGLASAFVTKEIIVATLPVIKIPEVIDGNITKQPGDKIRLTCEAEGHPEPNVLWLKFSYESNSSRIVKPAVPKSSVHEFTLSKSDTGHYVCLAINPAGSTYMVVRAAIETKGHPETNGQRPDSSLWPNQTAVDNRVANSVATAVVVGAGTVAVLAFAAAAAAAAGVVVVGVIGGILVALLGGIVFGVVGAIVANSIGVVASVASGGGGGSQSSSRDQTESLENSSEEETEDLVLEVYPKGPHVIMAGSSLTLECRDTSGSSDLKFTWSRENSTSFDLKVCQSVNCLLVIKDIAIDQEGGYRCSASNRRGSASITTEIEVRTLPVIKIPSNTEQNMTYKFGDKVELTCEAEGHPNPNVQWQKFSNESHSYQMVRRSTTTSAVYEITSLSTSEAGLYLCSAQNPAGSTNKTVQVVIKQPFLEVHPADPHVVIAGNAITLECRETTGYSNMTFTWSREDECSFASNVHQFENGSLTITDISLYQAGRFNCSAFNEFVSASITTEIEVRTLPDISIRDMNDGHITKKLGDKIELICEAEGHPEPTVQWQKFSNESQSYQTILRSTTKSAVHDITSLSASEAGLYLCSAVNLAGSSNKTVEVVIRQPVLEVYPENPHVVIAGNAITLECRETAGYSNMTFTWSREDECSFASNVHQFENGSLTITDISLYQGGRFNCSASNEFVSASITTEIEVRTLPDISIRDMNDGHITKKLGDKIELICEAEGHPEPTVQWQKFSNESQSYQTVLRSTTTLAVYEITSLSTSEAGLYLCSAVNLAGSSNKTVQVVIKQPILEVYPKDPHVVIAGNAITLECRETVGYPNMTFTWSREDECSFASNVHQFDNGSLTITDISLYQEGRFNCSASNEFVSASITTEIEVRTLPDISIRDMNDGHITKKLGDTIELLCEAKGHPEPTVQWQKFSNESHSYQIILRSTTKSAVHDITSLSTSEAGLYLCSAVNLAGSSNKTVEVVIRQPVLEVYPENPHVVIAGNAITLECRETAGYPNMTFTWSREDECSFASNVHQFENGSLTITDISLYQEGRFNCSASNGFVSASITTEIEVRTLPDINIRDMIDGDITKKLGDKVELICEAEGHPEPTVQWQKFSNESQSYQTILRSTTKSAVHDITSLSASEAGLYLCSAVNLAGSSNKTVEVVIRQPVLEVYPENPHVVIAGNAITLECRETAGYPNMTFTWSREDECSFASNVHQFENGSLTITDISLYQEGRFNCSASNGFVSASITTEIEVRTLPDINIRDMIDGDITKKLGDKVELICEAEGHPEPTVQWQKFSNESQSYQTILRSTTKSAVHDITSLSASEAGLYLCSAVNLAGSSNKTVEVVIRQPVLEVYPENPHVVIAGNAITLECRETAGYSNMTFTWSREDECSFASNVHQFENGSLTITDISLYQGGRFNCSASNEFVSASITTEIEVRTLPDISIRDMNDGHITKKLGDKIELICEAEGHPEPTVQWQKFSNESHSYQIILRSTTKSAVHDITSLSTSEAGLYLCSAVNLAGSSNKTVQVVIKQPILEVYPKDPHVVIAGNAITLECRETVGYPNMTFTWSREDECSFASNVHQFDNGSLTITDISLYQEGRFNCSASNEFVSASITTEIEVRTLPDISIRDMNDGHITKKLGDKIELICEAEGHPEPTVQWQKFSNESQSYQTVLRSTTTLVVYEITSLSTSEAGLYLCSAVNLAGSSNKTVQVVIKQPILEVYPKDPHVVIAGNAITLECRETVGYPNMTFSWSREDECSFASNVHQFDNGSLTITDISLYQEGRFNCSASNEFVSASITTEIEVRTLPDISIRDMNDGHITKKLGDTIELLCEAKGHPEPTVQWQKFSNESHSYQIILRSTTKSAVHDITSLSTSEAGLYLCSAVNLAGSSNKTVEVVIRQPVLEVYPENPHVVIAGNAITLECRETAGYPNMTFTWSREDECSFASNVHQFENGSLTITDISLYQEGRFNCSASNGFVSASITTEIEVRTLPDINIRDMIDGDITKKLGDKVELICEAEGHPEPTVQWQKFSNESQSYQTILRSTTKSAVHDITSLSASEAGLYLCSAVNLAGSSNKTVEVVIRQPVLEVYPENPHVVIAGNAITLECRETAGYSNMTFTWSGEDECSFASNVHQFENGSLTITDISLYQGGRFNCSASNEFVFVSITTEIEVRTLIDISIRDMNDGHITKKLGDKIELICEAEGHPEPTVQWQKFSNESQSYQTVLRSTTTLAVYEITSLSTSEAGLYLCSAVNLAGSSNKTVQVVIKQPILEVYPKDPNVVIAGNAITLECRETVGYPNMTFTWSREDECSFTSNVHQFENGSLTITDISLYQEGRFNCSASNGFVSASITTEIEVRTLPDINIRDMTDGVITKKLGDKVELICEAEGHPEPTVQWQKFSNESQSYQTNLRSTTKSAVHDITSLSTSEAGLYLCSAVNLAGSSNKTVEVVIRQPVLEVYPENPHVVIAGNAITLECRETAGYPNMTFTWSREDECSFASNVHQFENGSLTITDISLYQGGRFNCSASNEFVSVSITTEIEVRTLPDISIRDMNDGHITKKLGDKIELICEAEGHPEPTVQWQKFSNESQSYQTVLRSTTTSAVHEITSLSTSEAGLYLCSAVNLAGSSNKTVQVVIKQPILEVYPKDAHVVIAGNAITLECREIVGYPNMTFTWSREDECSFTSNVHQFENGSLTLTDIAIFQAGHFICSASNSLASASVTTEIEVRTLPDINIPEITDENITKKLGDRVELICEAEGHPKPSVQWQKFSSESHSYQTVLRATMESAVHEITSLSTSDAGLYLCLAVNPAGSSNKTIQVVIIQPTLEVYPQNPHVVIEGNSITLECRETAGYSNMTYTWSREDKCLFASNVQQADNGSLTITNIAIFQGGHLICSASNGLASASVTIEIEVRTLPDINIPEITDENITKKLGDRVELLCEAEGHPEPNVQWQKFSSESHSYQTVLRATMESAVYEITSLSTSDAGLYSCLAINAAGSSRKTVQIVIKQPTLEVYPEDPHVVILGGSITLECRESTGYSNMIFTWSQEGTTLLAPNVHQSDNGVLTITDIEATQEGRYKCFATNGKASASTTADIAVDSSISEVRITHSIQLPWHHMFCVGTGGKLSFLFTADPPLIGYLEGYSAENQITYKYNTRIPQHRTYCCEVYNSVRSRKTCLGVKKTVMHTLNPSGFVGEYIELQCVKHRSKSMENFHFEWKRKDGNPLPSHAIVDNYSIKFPKLTKSDAGTYACVQSSTYGGRSWSSSIEIPLRVNTIEVVN